MHRTSPPAERSHAGGLNGPTMMARTGMLPALSRGHVREFDSSRKNTHWGRRKLKTSKEVGDVCRLDVYRLKVFATAELADILFDALIVIGPSAYVRRPTIPAGPPCKFESSLASYSSP